MTDEVVPLGNDRFEQRVPVDRRRMEAMITGNFDVFPVVLKKKHRKARRQRGDLSAGRRLF